MSNHPSPALLAALRDRLGPKGFSSDSADLAPWLEDWRRRYHGAAAAMLSPASTDEVSDIVRFCADEGVALVPQGGNTSMVGGATPGPEGDALLLSMRRMNKMRSLSADANVAVAEAGVILAHLHDAATSVGRQIGRASCRERVCQYV